MSGLCSVARYGSGVRFRILVVCQANICRSPMGERILALRLDERGVGQAYDVRSAGVRAMVGREMAPQSAREVVERGGDPISFSARQLDRDNADVDLLLCATRELRGRVLDEFPPLMKVTFTVRELATLLDRLEDDPARAAVTDPAGLVRLAAARRSSLRQTDVEVDVADPIGRSDEVYAEVAVMLDDALTTIARHLAPLSDLGGPRRRGGAEEAPAP